MYPILAPEYAIRGTRQEQYLTNSRNLVLIPLEHKALTSIIKKCDGRSSLSSLARQFRVTTKEMRAFLGKFERAGILAFNKEPEDHQVAVALGPHNPWLQEVHIDITDRCNQANQCRHCFRGDRLNRGDDRGTDAWVGLLTDLSEMGVYRIAISGGEPLLRHDLPQIIRHALDCKMFLGAIFTNGSRWSKIAEEIVATLTDRAVETTFYISLDGPNAETHNANRGSDAFKETTDFISRLVELRNRNGAAFKIAVNSQVNSENVRMLLPWYQFVSELGIDRWRLTSGRVTGRLAKNLLLLPVWDELFTGYEKLIRKHITDCAAGTPIHLNVEGFFSTQMLNDRIALTFTEKTRICDYKEHACSIEPNGDVQFCTSWSGRRFGNVFVEGIRSIWYSDELQSLKRMQVGEIDECRGCELLEFCGGGCRLVAADLKQRDPYSCERYRRFKTRIVPILRAEGVQFTNERNG